MPYKIKKGLAFRRIAGEVYIVDAARSEMRELNGPASVIWEGLVRGDGERGLLSALTAEYEVNEKTARADLNGFVKELMAAGLIEATK
ncbi:MAG: PqqD family protein [Elusimicrobiales bacterium]|nr:PqqD family protein [Elusimicrobiales bacterium]